MYNEILKERFLETVTDNSALLYQYKLLFNAIAPYEEEWGRDICTRDEKDISPIIERLSGLRYRSRYVRLILLKKYIFWCIDTGVPGAIDGISKIDSIGYTKIKEMTVANPLHLQMCMDKVFDKESEDTIDNTYRVYLWLAYGGLPESDIIDVRTSDVHIEYMTVEKNGYSVPIYREAMEAFSKCVHNTQFYYKHPNYSNGIYRNRIDGDILIRGIKARPSLSVIRATLSKKFRSYTQDDGMCSRLSYNRVWLSGLFYRTKEMEDAGVPVNFEWAADEAMSGKTYNLSSGRNTVAAKRRQIINDYFVDYERWKAAFSHNF